LEKFDYITEPWLRAYNRYIFANNVFKDAGKAPAEDYVAQFNYSQQQEMRAIGAMVAKKGMKDTLLFIRNQTVFEDDVKEIMNA